MTLTTEQLALRKGGIGASEIAAACGLNPFCSPHDLWLLKRGLVEVEETEAMELGNLLEEPIARAYARRNPDVVLRPSWTVVHTTVPWAFCTPDRLVYPADAAVSGGLPIRLLECKSAGPGTAQYWGDGPDEIPEHYICQLQWQIEVCDLPEGDVAALVAGALRFYRIHRDRALAAGLLELGERFWRMVQDGTEPPLDGRESTRAWIASRFPRAIEQLREATPEESLLARQYVEAREATKAAQEEQDRLANELRARIGSAEGLAFAGGKATCKAPSGAQTAWKAVAEALHAPPDLIAANSKPYERRLDVRLLEGK